MKRPALAVSAVVASLVGCGHDWARFTSTEAGAVGDGAATGDGTVADGAVPDAGGAGDDGGTTNGSGGDGGDGGACGDGCLGAATACRSACVAAYNQCLIDCASDGGAARRCQRNVCPPPRDACLSSCGSTCGTCTTNDGCPRLTECSAATQP